MQHVGAIISSAHINIALQPASQTKQSLSKPRVNTDLRTSHKSLKVRHHKRQCGVKVVVDNLFYALSVSWRNCKRVASYLELHSVRMLLRNKSQYAVTEHAGPNSRRNVFLVIMEQVAIQVWTGTQRLGVHRNIG